MKTVLVIDSDAHLRKLISQWLAEAGWRVLEIDDGERGIQIALQLQPDAVICDLLMPGCNGFQICRSIREQAGAIEQPRIIVTDSSVYATNRRNAIEIGADDYLVKPFKGEDLVRILESRHGRRAAASTPRPPTRAHAPLPANQPPRLKFWGVRGSIPTPGPGTVQYGGNTSCVEVRADGEIIILDAGSGIRRLGLALAREFKDQPINLTLLITHTHWDHIQGFPFFIPAYNPHNRLRILGYEGARKGLHSTLTAQMESPYFPVSMRHMPGNIDVTELREREFNVGRVRVETTFVNHPGVCVGYRLFTSAGSIAYLPDNEPFQRMRSHAAGQPRAEHIEALKYASEQDQRVIEFLMGAEVLIVDSQYDDDEYQSHVGWGHGCVDDVVDFAVKARVRQLYLFHHDPAHDDEKVTSMLTHARALVAAQRGTVQVDAAREGLKFELAAVGKRA